MTEAEKLVTASFAITSHQTDFIKALAAYNKFIGRKPHNVSAVLRAVIDSYTEHIDIDFEEVLNAHRPGQ